LWQRRASTLRNDDAHAGVGTTSEKPFAAEDSAERRTTAPQATAKEILAFGAEEENVRKDSSKGRLSLLVENSGEVSEAGVALAAEVGEEPEEEGEAEAQEEAGDDGEVDGGVLAAIDDIAGEAAQAEGEFAGEVEKRAHGDEESAGEEEEAAEVAERVHKEILAEEGSKEVTKQKKGDSSLGKTVRSAKCALRSE
jgi:hypothetical protein